MSKGNQSPCKKGALEIRWIGDPSKLSCIWFWEWVQPGALSATVLGTEVIHTLHDLCALLGCREHGSIIGLGFGCVLVNPDAGRLDHGLWEVVVEGIEAITNRVDEWEAVSEGEKVGVT